MIIHGENAAELFSAFAKAQGSFNAPKKDKKGHNYKYADMANVIEATAEALTSNGLAIVQGASTDNNDGRIVVTVETVLMHTSGTYMEFPPLTLPPVKPDPQGIGSAITYARRYAYLAAVGIAPEDDDGSAASTGQRQAPQRERSAHRSPAPRQRAPQPAQSTPTASPQHANGAHNGVAVDDAPPVEVPPAASENPLDDGPPVQLLSAAQAKKIHAIGATVFGDGWNDARHEWVQYITGGAASSSSELSKDEASVMIECLTIMELATTAYGEERDNKLGVIIAKASHGSTDHVLGLTPKQRDQIAKGVAKVAAEAAQAEAVTA